MKALTYRGAGKVGYEDVPEPVIEHATDALVEVELAGICGSDLHVYHGRELGLDLGTVMGHEFAGRVAATGGAVQGLSPGDRVVAPFTTSCGRCLPCAGGLTARCLSGQLFGWVEKGAGLQGGQAQLVRVPLAASTLVKIPADLDFEQALLLADVLPTGYHGARNAGVEARGAYVVVGCGAVGLMAVLAARELGAATLYAVDGVGERLALAERFGAIPIDLTREDPLAVVRGGTAGRGAEGVIEAVGSPEAGRLAFALVRAGGTLAVVGVHHEAAFAFSPAQAYDKNLTYRSGRCPARALMEALVPLARRRRADLAGILTHRLPLSSGPAAYAMFAGRRDGCIKVALSPGSPAASGAVGVIDPAALIR